MGSVSVWPRKGRLFHGLFLIGKAHYFSLVTAKGKTFVKTGGILTLKLSHAPILLPTLNLIEVTFVRILDTHKNQVM